MLYDYNVTLSHQVTSCVDPRLTAIFLACAFDHTQLLATTHPPTHTQLFFLSFSFYLQLLAY